jgi:hypothetical protein
LTLKAPFPSAARQPATTAAFLPPSMPSTPSGPESAADLRAR